MGRVSRAVQKEIVFPVRSCTQDQGQLITLSLVQSFGIITPCAIALGENDIRAQVVLYPCYLLLLIHIVAIAKNRYLF